MYRCYYPGYRMGSLPPGYWAPPGEECTLAAITCKYWWQGISAEVKRAVKSCSICEVTKWSKQPPASKFTAPTDTEQAVVPHFVMDLVVVNRFSKSCWFLPFNTLSSAFQVAEALFQHVFCCYGLLKDILSDCGPQFVSGVWKAFFRRWGSRSASGLLFLWPETV